MKAVSASSFSSGRKTRIRNLETYRGYLGQLADPRKINDAQAQEIIAKAKPIYHLMGGLHSGETGPPEMLMELAYRLVTEDSPLIKGIRDHLIVSITPAADPDGRDRYADWYYRYKINETGEQDNLGGPPYWGKYIFHDDNRDINYSQLPMQHLLALVSAVAPADHARAARVGPVHVYVQRASAAEPDA